MAQRRIGYTLWPANFDLIEPGKFLDEAEALGVDTVEIPFFATRLIADTRLLHRARSTAVPATRGGGLHPNREVWVRDPRAAQRSGFKLSNRHRPQASRTF